MEAISLQKLKHRIDACEKLFHLFRRLIFKDSLSHDEEICDMFQRSIVNTLEERLWQQL